MPLRHWVNEGAMVLFFFIVGLEMKNEFISGALSSPRKALLPCLGALGGMVVPMLLYMLLNYSERDSSNGWAIPMATDIAFAMAVYGFFRNRMPGGATAFLLTLATVDDLGAILMIAIFFATDISLSFLLGAACTCAGLFLLERRGSKAAVHVGPTAGLLDHLLWHYTPYAVLIIMPLFALANCAVEVDMSVISGVLHTPVAHGIMVRIICIQRLGMGIPHLITVGFLGGIGFTMSLFLINLSLEGTTATTAKLTILMVSASASLVGALMMRSFPLQ
eukprot:gene7247-8631_t